MVSPDRLAEVFDGTPQQIINSLYNAGVDAAGYDDDGSPLYSPEVLGTLLEHFAVRPAEHAAPEDVTTFQARVAEGLDSD